MKKISLLIPLAIAACGTDQDILDFHANQTVDEGTGGTQVEGVGGMPSEPGGESASGGFGGAESYYKPGGYAGGHFIERDGARFDLAYGVGCNLEHQKVLTTYSENTCRAGSLCSTSCTNDADCESMSGPLDAACLEDVSAAKSCALLCNNDSDCLDGMICEVSLYGVRSCLLAETPWAPGCENFCLEASPRVDWDALCNVDAPCCDGLSCSPEGVCQARECLPGFWECEEGGVPCCDGTSCQSGFCQP